VAASQAKAEQVAELAEFNENIPLDDGDSRDQEEEELSKAEQEINALVEQVGMIFILLWNVNLPVFIIMFSSKFQLSLFLSAHSHRTICHEFP